MEVVGFFWCVVFASYVCFANRNISVSRRLHRICFSGNSKVCPLLASWYLLERHSDLLFSVLCKKLWPSAWNKITSPLQNGWCLFFSLKVQILNLTQLFWFYIYIYIYSAKPHLFSQALSVWFTVWKVFLEVVPVQGAPSACVAVVAAALCDSGSC